MISDLGSLISDLWTGGVAQLGERLLCKQEGVGSNPITSTTRRHLMRQQEPNLSPEAPEGAVTDRYWTIVKKRVV